MEEFQYVEGFTEYFEMTPNEMDLKFTTMRANDLKSFPTILQSKQIYSKSTYP